MPPICASGISSWALPKNETVLDNTASGAVSYTNLDGGTYTFCLRVFDPDDHTAVGQTLRVTIVKEKKLTEQPLFWAAGIAALVLLSVGTAIGSPMPK